MVAPRPVTVTGHDDGRTAWELARRRPDPRLDGVVLGYCGYTERTLAAFRRREVPAGSITLILSFGSTIEIVETGSGMSGAGRHRSFLAGIHDGHVVTEYEGDQAGVQIDLTPLGAYRLLGLPMSDVANRVVPLDELPNRALRRLDERLGELGSWVDRFDALDAVLEGFAAEAARPDPAVTWAWGQLTASRGRVPVAALADEIGWSRRHFGARFRSQVGLAPKATGRVLRFGHAVSLLTGRPDWTIADVAAAAGYADHSHLDRDFRALAGCTPSTYLAGQLPGGGGISA